MRCGYKTTNTYFISEAAAKKFPPRQKNIIIILSIIRICLQQTVFLAGAKTEGYFAVHTSVPMLIDLHRGVCMKVNSVKTCLSPLRLMWVSHVLVVCHIRFPLWPLVNGRALFTADHALFTSQLHMDPWVLFQLSEQQSER